MRRHRCNSRGKANIREETADAVNIGDGTRLNDLGLLIFTVFSGNDFAVKTSGYKHDYTVKVFYGALVPKSWEVHVKAFTITLEGDYLELNNGVFTKTDSAPRPQVASTPSSTSRSRIPLAKPQTGNSACIITTPSESS